MEFSGAVGQSYVNYRYILCSTLQESFFFILKRDERLSSSLKLTVESLAEDNYKGFRAYSRWQKNTVLSCSF